MGEFSGTVYKLTGLEYKGTGPADVISLFSVNTPSLTPPQSPLLEESLWRLGILQLTSDKQARSHTRY